MAASVFIAIFGAVFVLLGRWFYQHPGSLHPSWGLLNPENPGVQKFARAQATFVIFFGSFAFGGGLAFYVLPALSPILAIATGIAGTLFFRPRQPRPGSAPNDQGDKPATTTQDQPLLGRHWKRFAAISAAFGVLLATFVFASLGDSDISKLAFAEAQANPTVRQRLGEPIKQGFLISGSIETSGPSGRADLAIPIHGPKGSAKIYVVAQKSADLWKYETLQVSFGDGERFDLLSTASGAGSKGEQK